jgi:hypothetical protein
MAALRDSAAALGLTHRLCVYSHCCLPVKGLNSHKIALIGHGGERERPHQTMADAQLRSSGTDSCRDEGPVRELAHGLPVRGDGHLRRDGLAINAEYKYQRLPGWGNGTVEIALGVPGYGREETHQGGNQECCAWRTISAHLFP